MIVKEIFFNEDKAEYKSFVIGGFDRYEHLQNEIIFFNVMDLVHQRDLPRIKEKLDDGWYLDAMFIMNDKGQTIEKIY